MEAATLSVLDGLGGSFGRPIARYGGAGRRGALDRFPQAGRGQFRLESGLNAGGAPSQLSHVRHDVGESRMTNAEQRMRRVLLLPEHRLDGRVGLEATLIHLDARIAILAIDAGQ